MQSLLVNHTNNDIDSTIPACEDKVDKVCKFLYSIYQLKFYYSLINFFDILKLLLLNFPELYYLQFSNHYSQDLLPKDVSIMYKI